MKIWEIRKDIRGYNENMRNKEGYKRIQCKYEDLERIKEDTLKIGGIRKDIRG